MQSNVTVPFCPLPVLSFTWPLTLTLAHSIILSTALWAYFLMHGHAQRHQPTDTAASVQPCCLFQGALPFSEKGILRLQYTSFYCHSAYSTFNVYWTQHTIGGARVFTSSCSNFSLGPPTFWVSKILGTDIMTLLWHYYDIITVTKVSNIYYVVAWSLRPLDLTRPLLSLFEMFSRSILQPLSVCVCFRGFVPLVSFSGPKMQAVLV